MAILDQIKKENICINLQSTTKGTVLKELVDTLASSGSLLKKDDALAALEAREKLGSTGLGEQIAIPHAKTTAVESIAIAIGIAPQGINFDSLDGKPVKIFFAILANPSHAGLHIDALSEIAKVTRNASFCKGLINAQSADDIIDLLRIDD
jgi:fructose-specific phosphotransferase system IIA component